MEEFVEILLYRPRRARVFLMNGGVVKIPPNRPEMLKVLMSSSSTAFHRLKSLLTTTNTTATNHSMPSIKHVYIAVIGTGGVGKAFLSQLEALSHRYSSHPSTPISLSLVFLSRSSKSLLSEFHNPIPFASWESALASSSSPALPPAQLVEYLSKRPADSRAVLVDNTSSQDLADAYPSFLQAGVSVITPNKKAFSADLGLWDAIFSSARNGTSTTPSSGAVFHESTVGAGLPVLSTLRELIDTGDVVTKIEGVFSGTMSFLFNSFMPVGGGGGSFSAEVKKAKELGYTEPDPRDDLNGLDVARKLTILARIAGLDVAGPTAFSVQSLIPTALESCASGEEFVARLGEFDGEIEKVKEEARAEGKVLRYVGSVDVQAGKVEVGLQKFDVAHPIAALKGSDNIVNFYTRRYGANPLIIQGAGAGADVTAMGVTGDLIKVLRLA